MMNPTSNGGKKLVVVADDFGWCSSVNRGIWRAATEGIVTEVSLMLKAPGTEEALNLIRRKNSRNVGIHLYLCDWAGTGRRFSRADYVELFRKGRPEDVEKMADAEFLEFESLLGFKPSHICPQWGIHGNLKLLQVIIDYARENNIPVRLPRTNLGAAEMDAENYAAEIMIKRSGIRSTQYLFGHILGADLEEIRRRFLADLETVKDGETAEIITHPGYFDQGLLESSTLNFERARDLALAIDSDFKKEIQARGFTIVDYSQI